MKAGARQVSRILREAGYRPEGARRIAGHGGYRAARYPGGVAVSHRCGIESDDLTREEEVELRRKMHDAYARVLRSAGYVLIDRRPGTPVHIPDAEQQQRGGTA